jgi:predicted transposase/invertase (TIGR01784 family)
MAPKTTKETPPQQTSTFLNPFTDYGFKRLFGTEENKNLLIDFLNQLLPAHHQIVNLFFKSTEQIPVTKEERKAFFDINCITTDGGHIIIEMQKGKMEYFKDRTLLYTTYPIQAQARKSKKWNFKLEAVYFIGILDFFYEDKKTAKFMRDVKLRDQDNEVFYEKYNIIYLQMPAFQKKEHELETNLDRWSFFLKNLESFEELPQILQMPIFIQASKIAKLANMTLLQLQEYEKSKMEYNAFKAVLDTTKKDAEKKWKAIVMKQQKAKEEAQREKEHAQREKEEAQRKQEEAQRKQEEAQRNSIKTLLKYGIKPEEIATELNLNLEEVNQIIKNL